MKGCVNFRCYLRTGSSGAVREVVFFRGTGGKGGYSSMELNRMGFLEGTLSGVDFRLGGAFYFCLLLLRMLEFFFRAEVLLFLLLLL